MREIKFRYYNPLNGELVSMNNDTAISYFFKGYDNRLYSGENKPILEQFTGSKDKNGYGVYEGDIWERDGFIATVEFIYSGWHLIKTESSNSYQYPSFYSNVITGVIIGNIHQNPELLTT